MSMACPLYVKLEFRAITKSQRIRDRAVMISSTIPSAKYSWSGSPLMFWKGRMAIEGLSGKASLGEDCNAPALTPSELADGCQLQTATSRERPERDVLCSSTKGPPSPRMSLLFARQRHHGRYAKSGCRPVALRFPVEPPR